MPGLCGGDAGPVRRRRRRRIWAAAWGSLPGSVLEMDLPLDVVYDILLRLSVRTLSRFRCVSNPWCSLISEPRFQKDHRRRSQLCPLLLVVNDNESPVTLTTYTNDGSLLRTFSPRGIPDASFEDLKRFKIVQSCMGLVCLYICFGGNIHTCNPSTEEMITLPLRHHFAVCARFGYLDSTQEFKVVRFFTLEFSDEDVHCEVFTLGSSVGWRVAKRPPYFPLSFSYLPFLHGALHFTQNEGPQVHDDLDDHDDHYIAAFDLVTEEYRGIPLPESYYHDAALGLLLKEDIQLMEMSGSLCLTLHFGETKKALDFWLLKDYHGHKWAKLYCIDISYKDSYFWASPLAFTADDFLLVNIQTERGYELRCYDTQENCFTEKKVVEGVNSQATLYSESFLALGPLIKH